MEFINFNKCTTLVRDADSREGKLGWPKRVGQAVYEKSLYFPFNFGVNLKLLLKMYFLKSKDIHILAY